MSLLDIFWDKITEADLNNLISTGVPKSPTIDYKRDTYGNSDSDKREFLADLSSFANNTGGDIVIGMDEASGLPTAFKPLTVDIDTEVRRLEKRGDFWYRTPPYQFAHSLGPGRRRAHHHSAGAAQLCPASPGHRSKQQPILRAGRVQKV